MKRKLMFFIDNAKAQQNPRVMIGVKCLDFLPILRGDRPFDPTSKYYIIDEIFPHNDLIDKLVKFDMFDPQKVVISFQENRISNVNVSLPVDCEILLDKDLNVYVLKIMFPFEHLEKIKTNTYLNIILHSKKV